MKKIFILFFIVLLSVVCACNMQVNDKDSIMTKTHTYWESEDGDVWFYITERGHAAGKITVDNITYPVYIRGTPGLNVYVYSIDGFSYLDPFFEDLYEEWTCDFDGDSYRISIVNSEFGRKGSQIVIRRCDDKAEQIKTDYKSFLSEEKTSGNSVYSLSILKNFFGKYPGKEYNSYVIPYTYGCWEDICNNFFSRASVIFEIDSIFENDNTYYTVFPVEEGGEFFVFWELCKSESDPLPFYYIYIPELKSIEDFAALQIGTSSAQDVADISSAIEIHFDSIGFNLKRANSYTLLSDGTLLQIQYEYQNECNTRDDLIVESIEQVELNEDLQYLYLNTIIEYWSNIKTVAADV